MLFQGVEIVNSAALVPGRIYFLVKHEPRTINKRDGTKKVRLRARALVNGEPFNKASTIARIRVFRDRLGRVRAEDTYRG